MVGWIREAKPSTWIAIGVALLVSFVATTASAQQSPTEFIKGHAADVTDLLAQEESAERSEKFSEKAQEIIDFRMLASRALEGYWEDRTAEEQDEFLSHLQELLEANYKRKLEGYELGEDYELKYLEEKKRGDRAVVKMRVKWGESEKKQKPVDYRMIRTDEGWVVYDVVTDGASLEQTYREAYTEIIEEDGWETLIDKMESKIEELKSGNE